MEKSLIISIAALVSLLFSIVAGNRATEKGNSFHIFNTDKDSPDHRQMIYVRNIHGPFTMFKLDGKPENRKFGDKIHCEGKRKEQFDLRGSGVEFDKETMTYKCPMPKEGGIIMKFTTVTHNYVFIATHNQILELNKVELEKGDLFVHHQPIFLLNEPMRRLLKLHDGIDNNNVALFEALTHSDIDVCKTTQNLLAAEIDKIKSMPKMAEARTLMNVELADECKMEAMFTGASIWEYNGNHNFLNDKYMAYVEKRKEGSSVIEG